MYIHWLAITIIAIWLISGIVTIFTKKDDIMNVAGITTILMGIGYYLYKTHQ